MFIEIRVAEGKYKLKRLIRDIRRKARLRERKVVPHISIYEPDFCKARTSEIVSEVDRICQRYSSIPFTVDGFDYRTTPERKKVVALKITPSKELEELRQRIADALSEKCPSDKPWDTGAAPPWFHITVANKLPLQGFEKCWKVVMGEEEHSLFQKIFSLFGMGRKRYDNFIDRAYIPMHGVRLAILNDQQRIIAEYDFAQRRMLNRGEALDRRVLSRTLSILRKQIGYELTKPSFRNASSVFLISDLHLDHKNIIWYCGRPFVSVGDMNAVLVRNWNYSVSDRDEVYFLGDLTYGKGSRSPSFWLPKLRGKKTIIQGSHDSRLVSEKYKIIRYKGYRFLLVHDPDKLPIKWDGWVIHGHKHNSNVRKYPFINGERKTINVSAELINFRPVSIDYITSLGLETIVRKDTLDSYPIRR